MVHKKSTEDVIAEKVLQEIRDDSSVLAEKLKKDGWPTAAIGVAVRRVNLIAAMSKAGSPQAVEALKEVMDKTESMVARLLIDSGGMSETTARWFGVIPTEPNKKRKIAEQAVVLDESLKKKPD